MNPSIIGQPPVQLPVSDQSSSTLAYSVRTSNLEPRVYKRRWLMLAIFCSYSATNGFQWLEYPIISDVISKYYLQSSNVTDWLSLIYMLSYIPLIFPVTWLLDRKGFMIVAVIGSFGNALGAIIKVLSAHQELFYVTFIGQTICSMSQVCILGVPARLAALWFGPKEVSTATALGVFGNQLGNAIGFLLPPVLVPKPDPWDQVAVEESLQRMFYIIAGITTAQFLLVIFAFKGKPPVPPSYAQVKQVEAARNESYLNSVKSLISNKGYCLLILTYGMNVGSFYAISTLLNQIMLHYFPGENENVGRIGLLIVLAGLVGSVVIGIVMDRFHKFKLSTVIIYIGSACSMLLFAVALRLEKLWLMFIIAAILGFTMTSYLPLGFEFAAEITFPSSEGTSSGLLNASAQAWGIALTLAMEKLAKLNVFYANLLLVVTLATGALITVFIKEDLRRQRAENQNNQVTRL